MKALKNVGISKNSGKAILILSILLLSSNLGITQSTAPTLDQVGAIRMFLQIDNISGESVEQHHPEWIEISSYEWGVLASGDTDTTRASSRAEISDFFFTKIVDKSSPKILEAAIIGTAISMATFHVTKQLDGENKIFIEYIFENLRITSFYQTVVDEHNAMETFSFTFQKVTYRYTEFDSSGNPGGTIEFVYDRSKP